MSKNTSTAVITLDLIKDIKLASRKAGKEVAVDWATMPEASLRALFAYGCQRFVNDKLGGADLQGEELEAAFDGIVAKLQAGWEGRAQGASKAPVDPIAKQVWKLATDAIKGALRAKGIAWKDVDAAKRDELIAAFTAKNAKALEAQAKIIVDAQATPTVDLESLGL
jgi:hypothetical protein